MHNAAQRKANNMVTAAANAAGIVAKMQRKRAPQGRPDQFRRNRFFQAAGFLRLPPAAENRERARMKSRMRGAISLRKREPLKTP